MSNILKLTVEPRAVVGTSNMRRLRRLDGKVPAVIYGAEKENQAVMIPANIIQRALENEAFASSILTLDVAGDKQKVILKAVQRHPWKPKIMHLDFYRINAKEKLNMTVAIHFTGEEECPGVKEGGVVSRNYNELEIRCLPGNLPEFIEVDVANLEMDQVLHLSDIKVPEGVELVAMMSHGDEPAHDHVVVAVHKPVITEESDEDEDEISDSEASDDADDAKDSDKE